MTHPWRRLEPGQLPHGLIPMTGRDPDQRHRASSPMELLYDLTVVVAISVSGSQFSHAIVTGHLWSGLVAFLFAMFAVIWAWFELLMVLLGV